MMFAASSTVGHHGAAWRIFFITGVSGIQQDEVIRSVGTRDKKGRLLALHDGRHNSTLVAATHGGGDGSHNRKSSLELV